MAQRRTDVSQNTPIRFALRSAALVAILMLATLASPAATKAGETPYLLLRPQGGQYVNPGPAQPVSRPSYSYGYFGAGRHHAHVWHEGYYGAWRQKTVWYGR